MSLLCLKCANDLTHTESLSSRKGLQGPTRLGPWPPPWHFLLPFLTKPQPRGALCPSLNTPKMLLPPSIWHHCPYNLEFSSYRYLPWLLLHFLWLSAKCHLHQRHQYKLSHPHCFIFLCSTFHFTYTHFTNILYLFVYFLIPHSPKTL